MPAMPVSIGETGGKPMSTTQTWLSGPADDLSRMVQAARQGGRVRVAIATTRDRQHALNALRETAITAGASVHLLTPAGRWRYEAASHRWEPQGRDVAEPWALLQQAEAIPGTAVAVIEDGAAPLRDDGGDVRLRMRLASLLAPEHIHVGGLVIVFLEPSAAVSYLPSVLADQFVRLEFGYPRRDELEHIARSELAAVAQRSGAPPEVSRIREQSALVAAETVGLTRSAAREAIQDAFAPDALDFPAALGCLALRKRGHLARELAMRILDDGEAEEPVGLGNLVRYIKARREQVRQHGPGRAKGILLLGPPGTGKTMLARAVGRLVELPVVEFRLSSLMNSLLGETERRFAQAFATLEAMSPNVVFIDEIEKAFGDSSERDGGTMMRCTGALLSWLSDNVNPNFIVATANNVSRMGEVGLTMTRSERFDAAFFVDIPGRAARREMLRRWLPGQSGEDSALLDEVADATERFSGADIRSCVKEAVTQARHENSPVDLGRVMVEVKRKQRRASALYDQFEELREWGRVFCEPAGDED